MINAVSGSREPNQYVPARYISHAYCVYDKRKRDDF